MAKMPNSRLQTVFRNITVATCPLFTTDFLPAAKIIFDLLPNKFLPLLYQLPVFLVLNSCVCRPRKFHFHTLP